MAAQKTLVWTICLYKNADMDEAEFHRYLSEHHGPMVKEVMLKNGIEQYACPPFAQPDYDTGRAMQPYEEDEEEEDMSANVRLRRGSEGYEVRPVSAAEREALVRRYAVSRGLEPDRYHRYDPNEEDNDTDESDV